MKKAKKTNLFWIYMLVIGLVLSWSMICVGDFYVIPVPKKDSISGWVKIEEIVLSADTISVHFNSIPAGYRIFLLYGNLRITSPMTRVALRFNADTGTNYHSQVLIANGTTVSASRWTDSTSLELEDLGFAGMTEGDAPRAFQALITNNPGYVKLVQAQLSVDPNKAAGPYMVYESTAGRWSNAVDEINQITILDSANSYSGFRSGSRFILYGSP